MIIGPIGIEPMIQGLLRAAKSSVGRIVLSIILGLGLATLFRRTCHALDCFSFRAPPWDEVSKTTYRYGDKCYQFKPRAAPCIMKGPKHIEIA